jgi:MacB-like periplasmic core domain
MGINRFFRRAQWDRERLAEIESYVQIEADENMARGMREKEAYAAARRKFGNITLIREEIYRMNSVNFAEAILSDIQYGLRTLRAHPTFTAVALMTLSIGIGANTAVFSVVNSVPLKPLAYPNPDELVAIRQVAPAAGGLANVSDGFLLSPSMYVTYDEHNRSFQSMGVWAKGLASVTGIGEPEQVRDVGITDGVLEALRVAPALGRWLASQDQVPNGPRNLMLGNGYWQRRFGGLRSVIGRTIRVDERSWQIVGVMPRGRCGFRFADATGLSAYEFGAGRVWVSRDRQVEAGGNDCAGECRHRPDAADLDGLLDQRTGHQSAIL